MACDCDCMMRKRIAKLEAKVAMLEILLKDPYHEECECGCKEEVQGR